jgi:hypothetical protein
MERIAKYISPEPMSGCWLWTGAANRFGRGYVGVPVQGPPWSKMALAHRVMLQETTGKSGEGLCACHKCDNPACVNPDHLYWGTLSQNSQDSVNRGRGKSSVLVAGDIPKIVSRLKAGERYASIAKDYGVTKDSIGNISRGQRWSHISGIGVQHG